MKTLLLAFVFACSPVLATACSCAYYTTFCEGVSEDSEVASVRMFHTFIHDGAHYVNAEFLEMVQGAVQIDTVTLRTGIVFSSCSPAIDQFKLGDTLIFSLGKTVPDAPSQFDTYRIGAACSTNFRIVRNGMVNDGNRNDGQTVPYLHFLENFAACAELTYPLDEDWRLSIYPVPANTELNIMNPVLPDIQYEFFSATGRLISNPAMTMGQFTTVDVSDFPVGMYFIRFQLNGEERVKRFVVQ